ncbi:BnaA01g35610D [Brassica napus]|uniref:BnaA01g35610D protein n=2 Tax=Brassica TaxID=3705 RepID=A0A078IK19_BRANA|nr:BnaA01g35610D [Brassica napus]VDC75802.1 unnamed protein product [Brassica rapa]
MLLWQILSPWTYFWRRHVLLEMDGISGYSRRAQIGEILEVHMRKFEHIVVIWDWYLMMICWYKDSISANHKSGEKMRLGDNGIPGSSRRAQVGEILEVHMHAAV